MEGRAVRFPRSKHGGERRRQAPVLVLATLVALVVAGGGSAAGGSVSGAGGAYTDLVTVSAKPQGNVVPGAFVGISLEYGTVSTAELPGPGGADSVLAQLIRNLSPGYAPIVRIGGDSGDKTWWPVPGIRAPRGIKYALTPEWLADARALAQSSHARLILGINLETDSTAIAAAEARHLVAGIGRRHIEALEIGNEPELYAGVPWYVTRSGQRVFARPATYDLADYVKQFAALAAALPRVPLAGPSTGADSWIAGLGQLLAANPTLRLATFHAYALDPHGEAFRGHDCATKIGEPAHPSVGALLDSYGSQSLVQGALPYIAIAHSHGIPFRIDEMNAITCAGAQGISNSAASALWVLDELFQLVRAGVNGVNIHTWKGSAGKLFDMDYGHGRWVGTVSPEYYGMLMFVQAAPPGSRLESTGRGKRGPLRSWAVLAPDGTTRVVLINDSLNRVRWVLVRSPVPSARADLDRLEAPSAYAQSGITLGGQSFGPRTTTGLLSGPASTTLVQPSSRGYLVRMPPASAALLTIHPRR